LLRVEDEVVNWKGGNGGAMHVPSIGSAETAMWIGHGAPVRQIRFARPVEKEGTWMAVRFSQDTIVFRPSYHSRSALASLKSCLDTNQIVTIPASQTGGCAHTDVAFNPWYQKQLGIIDERGNWSIWNLPTSGRRKRKDAIADCVKSGSLPWVENDEGDYLSDRPRYDGWAAIEWAGDVNKLIVCDRRCIVLYLVAGDPIRSCSIELGLKQRTEWILDIQRSPSNVSHVFILTTLRIFWLDVNSSAVAFRERNTDPVLCPQLYLYHFRNDDDTTLHLAALSMDDGMIYVSGTRWTC
jgi:RNA polymerase I-specific transcription initiation factor RRN6